MWENAYSSLKRVERPINLFIILFATIPLFKKSEFCYSKNILEDVLDKYVQKSEKNIFCKQLYFYPIMHIFIFTFQFCYMITFPV